MSFVEHMPFRTRVGSTYVSAVFYVLFRIRCEPMP